LHKKKAGKSRLWQLPVVDPSASEPHQSERMANPTMLRAIGLLGCCHLLVLKHPSRWLGPGGTPLVVDVNSLKGSAKRVEDRKERAVLVVVATNLIIGMLQYGASPRGQVASQLPV